MPAFLAPPTPLGGFASSISPGEGQYGAAGGFWCGNARRPGENPDCRATQTPDPLVNRPACKLGVDAGETQLRRRCGMTSKIKVWAARGEGEAKGTIGGRGAAAVLEELE